MKKNWWIIALVFFGIFSLFFILSRFSFKEVYGSFKEASLPIVIGYLAAVTLIMMTLAWRWQVVLKSQKHHFPFFTLLKYKIIGFGINFITPGPRVGGEPAQAALLSRHGISFHKSLSSIVIDKTIELTTSGLFFFIGVIILLLRFALPEDLIWLLIIISGIFILFVVLFIIKMLKGKIFFFPIMKALRLHKFKWIAKYEKNIIQFEMLIIKFYRKDSKYFGYTILISLLSWLFMFFEYYFVMRFFGYSLTPLQIFLIFSFVGAAYLFPIPLALGVLEAAQISVFNILGINVAAAVGLAMIIRAKDIIWTIIGFTILSFYSVSYRQVFEESIAESSLIKEIDDMEKYRIKKPKLKTPNKR